MSHVICAHVADWLDASAASIDTLLQTVPRYSDDVIPDAPTLYDAYRDDWVAFGALPATDDELAEITAPLVAVQYMQDDVTRVPHGTPVGTSADSVIKLRISVAIRGTSAAGDARALSYYVRATKGSLWALGFGTNTDRTATDTGIRLGRVQSMSSYAMQPTKVLTSVAGIDVSYDMTETIPVSA